MTTQNLTVHAVDAEQGLLLLKGAVPGPNGGLVLVRTAAKGGRCQVTHRRRFVDAAGETAGTVELPAEVFDVQVNIPLIHQVVVAQLAAARQGTHATKTRGEVSGGGRSRTARRAPAGPARARSARRSSPAVASCTARSRATTRSGPPRR